MKTRTLPTQTCNLKNAIFSAALLFLTSFVTVSLAATTDISNVPLASNNPAQAKPNIMLLMDTSGSMGWTHMPDILEGALAAGVKYVGYKSPQCNALYYNPTQLYALPKQADGTFLPAPSFTSARYDAYDTASTTVVDLSTSFKAYDDFTLGYSDRVNPGQAPFNDTPQAAYYYLYSGTQTLVAGQAPCNDAEPTLASSPASGGGTWTRVTVSATSGPATSDERQNFANWYTYYRTRMSLTKSAASLAFNALTDSFRVGFITVQPKTTPSDAGINSAKYLAINDFDQTQRTAWYAKLFAQQPGGASPAREGLARVGRHYAGKQDGINTNMTGDPMQFSCQQNFTIMTTDGYWNDQTETPSRGPVMIDGVTRVGQQDGTLTSNSGLTPRPIWEGFADGTRVTADKSNLYYFSPCTTGWYNETTSQVLASTTQMLTTTNQMLQSTTQALQSTSQDLSSTTQNLQDTTQMLQSTVRNLQSTLQRLKSTNQNLQSTNQNLQSTVQNRQSTVQNLRSTVQNLQSTSQNVATTTQNLQTVTIARQSTVQNRQSTVQNRQSTVQNRQSTVQNRRSTVQNLKNTQQNLKNTQQVVQSTNQNRQSTVQNLRSTTQNLRSTTQNLMNTNQNRQSTVQNLRSTTQNLRTTVQNLQSTAQALRSTSQIRWYNPSTELWDPVQVCPGGGTCQTVVTTNVPVATCVAGSATAGNSWTATTCSTNNTTNVPVQTCTASGPVSPSFITTTCSTNNTTNDPVATCVAATASAGNNWTTTSCPAPVTTTNVPVATCTAAAASAGNNYTTTTCPTPVTTTNVPVATCTAAAASAGNNYTTTTCPAAIVQTNVPTASCAVTAASAGNNWTSITSCPAPVVTTNVPVATCTAAAASAGNNWTTTTCPAPVVTTNVPVATCTAAAASAGNSYTTTTCPTPVTTTNVPVATCTAAAASAGNSYTTTTCPAPVVTTNVGVATCTAAAASAGNSWTTTTCPAPIVQTNVPTATCAVTAASAGNSWTAITSCPAPIVQTNVPTATCAVTAASAGNNWTAITSCPAPVTTTNVPVATCTAAAASAGNNWTTTTCPAPVTTTNVPVATCTASAASAGNNWTTTTCPAPVTTTNVPVATCTASAASAGNNWTTTTCPAPVTTTNVPVATCTASAASAGNNWTTTTCPAPVTTTNVAVAACTPATANAGNSYTTTTCSVQTVSGPTAVASCTPIAPTAGNGYQNTSCSVLVNSTPVQTCTPIAGSAGNNWVTTTCGVNTTTAVPVATCTAAAASAGNSWTTTTCPAPIVTTAVPVATCTAAAASAGNNWTTTTCPAPVTTTNVPVATCTAAAASAGNSWTATTCNPLSNLNVPVATCTAVAASAGNSWTTTTCPPPVVTTAVPVATCTAAAASAGNSWTTTTCPAPNVTTNIPVASCTAAAASSTNSYTTTTCPAAIITTNVPVATCTAQTAAAGNNYVRITCPAPIVTTNVPVASCTADTASAANTWTTTTCSPNNLSNTPVATCTAASANSGNNWTTTTCPAPVVTTSVPVATCTAAAASSGNNWTATTCPAPVVTSNVPVQTCTAVAEAAGNNWTTTTCSSNSTSNVPVQTCVASVAGAGNNWTETTCSPNNAVNVPAQNCTASVASAANNWVATSCTPNNTSNVPVATCTGATGSVANNWTTTTCTPVISAPVFNNTCTAAAAVGPNFIATVCTPVTGDVMKYQTTTTTTETLLSGGVVVPGVTPVVTITTDTAVEHNSICYLAGTPTGAAPPLPTPNPQAPGLDISPWSPAVAGPALPSGCSAWPCSVDQTNVGGSINSLADVAQYYYVTDLRPAADWPATIATDNVPSIGGGPEDDKATWQHMTTFTIALGVSGTLDYRSDYRSANILTGDFAGIRSGIKNWPLWPDPTKSIPAGAGNLTWDSTTQTFTDKNYWNDARSIDDFWHAAVNGRGQYFSAGTPTAVVTGLTGALAGIQSRLSSGAAAGVSNIQPIAGDNFIYVGNYTTSKWTGEVQAREIDVTTGAPGATALWSAQAKLDALTSSACDNRNIYLIRDGATNNMVNFSWNSFACASDGSPTGVANTGLNASEQAQFNSTKVSLLSQFTTMTDGSNGTVDQKTPAAGENLLNYLRGQRGKENFESNVANKLYRARDHVLGDIVNGQPVYVKAPFASYVDRDYDTFKLAQQNRTPMVYVPANDGMLHALYANVYQPFPNGALFDPLGGAEAWAIVPSVVLPNLYKLADNNYANTHTYSVDGTPMIADIDAAGPPPADPADPYTSDWKTILVAGLNAGGKGYYAVDVTVPATPKVLWEFKWSSSCWNGVTTNTKTDCHIGYTFGKPVITKLADGRWVVMFTSGYNNINSPVQTGDGLGYLYVINANTGALIYKIATTAGDSTTPSGLAQINNYVDNGTTDNRTTRVYGADELGNIWRFDVNDQIAPLDIDDGPGNGREAVLLGTAKDSNGVGQPITTRPELAELNGQTRVYVGTGRLLGPSDLDPAQARSTQQQSVYGFIDPVTPPNAALPLNPIYSDLRAALRPLTMTQVGTGSTATRTVACGGNTADCTRPSGWVVDLPDSGERVNVDLKLVFGTLTFASNVPQSNACSIGGYSWFNYLNYNTGLAVSRSPNLSISQYVSNSLVVGMNALLIPPSSSGGGGAGLGLGGGLGTPGMILCTSDGNCIKRDPPVDTAPPAGKRISWREVVNAQ